MSQIVERERRLDAVPSGVSRPWWQRMLRSPLFWLTLVLVPLYAYFLHSQWQMFTTSETFEDGTQTLAFTNETVKRAAALAAPTALVYAALFIWLDRFRPQNVLVWLLTFGWGAAASTWFSLHTNTWLGRQMATTDADADMGSRAAIFSAPFTEEVSKATVLFLLLILFQRKIVSRLSMVALAGLSAIGFAFVENIIYYGRVITYAVTDISVANPEESIREIVLLRGLYTSFGHPLFTILTATGLVVGMQARSRIVRIVAPLAGFLMSVLGHMIFNGLSSTRPVDALKIPWIGALVLVALLIASLAISVAQQSRLIRHRLTDYQKQGWLTERDVELFSGPFRRYTYLAKSIFWGPKRWWYTAKLVRRVTELAYLRSEATRGIVADGALARSHDLLEEIDELRPKALSTDPNVRPLGWRKKKAAPVQAPQPNHPGPAGLGGNWPAR